MDLKGTATPASAFVGSNVPDDDFITQCMHCGLCLPTCPTYAITGLEKSSPRGRIRMIKAVSDGELKLTQGFIEEMNFCLDCQACETACPAGVKYGALVESARVQIFQQGKVSWFEKVMKRLFLGRILSSKKNLKSVARLLRLFQRSDWSRRLSRSAIFKFIAPKLHALEPLSPRIDSVFFDESAAEILKPAGPIKHRVAFLTGCIMNVAFADVDRDTIEILLHNDCEVLIPQDQECCGSLQAHNGDISSAERLARHNIDLFLSYNPEWIITNSAGCGAFMKEYERYLSSDPAYKEKAEVFSRKVKDLTEFLVAIDFKKPMKPYKKRVTYHDACHLAHAQRITEQPRAILQSIPGLELVELPEASWCCGSAGIYNIVRYDDSMKFLERKMKNVASTEAEIIVANNPGCITQMKYGLETQEIHAEVIHLATLLNRAYASGN